MKLKLKKLKNNQRKKETIVHKPTQQNDNNSYSNLLYESSVDKLKTRMMNERARNLIMSVMPNYG